MLINRLLFYFRLGGNAEDPAVAMATIERGVTFRGTNLMILVFAILIASVGLNVNSAAVVIGAMLISPLMGPIVGAGAALGVMDLALLRRALLNFGFAVVASLVTSTLYFAVSPLSEAHSEILARTSPTIWDVLIALAGGFAGVIAVASRERGNVVPGVAIATALMPPLCTAGYGLAHLNWPFFLGAFYLFLINSVFISLATLFTVRWLGYPLKTIADHRVKSQVRNLTTIIVLATVIPSVFLAYRLVLQNRFTTKANEFVTNGSTLPANFLVRSQVDAKRRTIALTYMGNGISDTQRTALHERLAAYGIKDATLDLRTGLSLQELGDEKGKATDGMQRAAEEKQLLLNRLAALNDSLLSDRSKADQWMLEAKAQHPTLLWLSVADMPATAQFGDSISKVVNAHFGNAPNAEERERFQRWIATKLSSTRHLVSFSDER